MFKNALDRTVCLVGKDGSPMRNQELGALGEDLAVLFLKREGRKVLYRNYRGPQGGELDIVARHGEALTFVEVKTRRAGGRGRPLDAVTRDKRELMRRGGRAWMKLLRFPDVLTRFDVVEIILREGELPEISVVENVRTHTDWRSSDF